MKICLYSPIRDSELFARVGFYRDDIEALSLKGDDVMPTNNLLEVIKYKPDLLVGYFYSKSIIAALFARLVGGKVILTGGADQISPVLTFGFRLFVHRVFAFVGLLLAHRVFLSCQDDVVNFYSLTFGYKFLSDKIRLVNHVVIPVVAPENVCTKKQKDFNAISLCWMGSEGNAIRKGIDKSIELISKLRNNGVNARLQIAGTDGPGRVSLEKLCESYGVSEYVSFLGAITEEEKKKLFLNNTVYLQLSKHEGFGVAAAEAYFSGMVVIHSNKGGLKDVIGKNGIVYDPDMLVNNCEVSLNELYSNFLSYNVDLHSLNENLSNYSIEMRSNAFLEDCHV